MKASTFDNIGLFLSVVFMAMIMGSCIYVEPYEEISYGPRITVSGTISRLEYQPRDIERHGKFVVPIRESYIIYLTTDTGTLVFHNVQHQVWNAQKEGTNVTVSYRQEYLDRKSVDKLIERKEQKLKIDWISEN
jgi:hypothetical protein